MKRYPATEKTRVRRLPRRAHYDAQTIHAILDAGFICHIGYTIGRQPFVTPTAYWREDDHVYWHGSHASRMLDRAANRQVCLTVTHVDGLVLARSAFHHSINYRSVMLFGTPRRIDDEDHKRRAMRAFVERMYPGSWDALRPVTRKEFKATTVLTMRINEASAKIRSGGPIDDAADYGLTVWAGVVPVRLSHGAPLPDARLARNVAPPAHVLDLSHAGLHKEHIE